MSTQPDTQESSQPGYEEVLAAAVDVIDGTERPGQQQMAQSVADAIASGQHLLVQAGTGTGKSLGYLAPALMHLVANRDERIVIATATLALQAQLAEKDIPHAIAAVKKVAGRTPTHAVLKGRSNYACLLKVRDGAVEQDALITGEELAETIRPSARTTESAVGAEVVALREWAEGELETKGLADRDDAPSHQNQAWQQVSVPVRECLGATRCPYGEECFVERSREKARAADLVVTNHALLAIDAMHGGTAIPEHQHVIIDEAHELVSRVTGAASAELSPQQLERVARRVLTWLDDELGLEFLETGDTLRAALEDAPLVRVTDPDAAVVAALSTVRDVSRRAASKMSESKSDSDNERRQAAAAVKEVFDVAERMAALAPSDVVHVADRDRFGREVRVSPLSVAGLMREKILSERTAVLTSATLKLGGDFTATAGSIGLRGDERRESAPEPKKRTEGSHPVQWRGVDVGSPFDYRRQGILYVARNLAPPTREGISPENLAEVAELVWAAGGRTLGLFASRRSAELAAAYTRKQLGDHTILCQGDAQLSELTRRFTTEPETSLFGTVSLWQGIDVPGDTCELVIIEKLPFPRPDDPLMVARQQAVSESGGNGFMAVAATHAALLMAQGSGRLIRRTTDKGVVAVLDPRLVTKRYGSFLRSSMPDMWMTSDREVAVQALRRLQDGRGTAAAG